MPRPRFSVMRDIAAVECDSPSLGSMKPAIICNGVVLPQPDGPSSETNSPFSTAERQTVDGDVAAEMLGQMLEGEERHV